MTYRELLELAEKSAEYKMKWAGNDCWSSDNGTSIKHWNPLTDDGDALRLAVKLNLSKAIAEARWITIYKVDIYNATRRAIVREAAEIGKAML